MGVDAAGNSYVVGTFQGTVDFDPAPGAANVEDRTATGGIYLSGKLNGTGAGAGSASFGVTALNNVSVNANAQDLFVVKLQDGPAPTVAWSNAPNPPAPGELDNTGGLSITVDKTTGHVW